MPDKIRVGSGVRCPDLFAFGMLSQQASNRQVFVEVRPVQPHRR